MSGIITHETPREYKVTRLHNYLFKHFFDSMLEEMDRNHEKQNGNSWLVRNSVSTGHRSVTEMDDWLDCLLFEAVEKYKESKDISQLTDIANFCAMRSIRARLSASNESLSTLCAALRRDSVE